MADWNPRANDLFLRAIELPPADRPAFLARECGGDAELRAAVDALLAAHAEAGEFLDAPHPDADATRPADDAPTRTLGHTSTEDPPVALADAPPGYEILRPLGVGGMGVVYLARQLAAKREVALKMIRSAAHASESERARFRAEAEAVAQLRHPGIVAVYEVGEHRGQPFFTLELCAGGSLADKLDGTPWAAAPAARLVEMVADAIHSAHQAGIIHRDLKPANVLIAKLSDAADTVRGGDGRPLLYAALRAPHGAVPKVTDFGISKRTDSPDGPTATGAVMGTPSYMAPEQASGDSKGVGPTADVWAMGAILYELLTGRPPFKAATVLDTLEQVRASEPVAARALNPVAPRDLETVAHKCLQKDPAKRYASAAALADDLRRFQEGRPITARPVGAAERAWRWCRRNPAVATLASAVAVVLLAGVVVSTAFGLRAQDEAAKALAAKKAAEDNADLAQRNEDAAKANEKTALAEADNARHAAYIARVTRGGDALRTGDVAGVRAALEHSRPKAGDPDPRGWEWHVLNSLVNRPATRYRYSVPGQGQFSAPAVSADGGLMALHSTRTEDLGEAGGLAGAFATTTLRVADPADPGRWVVERKVSLDINSGGLAVSAAGSVAVSAAGTRIEVFDTKTGKPGKGWTLSAPVAGVRGTSSRNNFDAVGMIPNCVFDPSGRRLAVSLSVPNAGREADLFNPDGVTTVVEVWDVHTATRVGRFAPAGTLDPARLDPVLAALTGVPAAVPPDEFDANMLQLGPGGKTLALLCHPRFDLTDVGPLGAQTVPRRAARWVVWDVDANRVLWQADEPRGDPAFPAAFSADGTRLYAARGNQLFVRDAATGKELERLPPFATDVTAVAASADGKLLAVGERGGAISLIDPTGGYPAERLQTHEGGVLSVAVRADPPAVVSVSDDGFVHHLPLSARSLTPVPKKEERRNEVATPDGKFLVQQLRGPKAGSAVVERATGRVVLPLPGDSTPRAERTSVVAFTPDSRAVLVQVVKVPPAAEREEARLIPLRYELRDLSTGDRKWELLVPPAAERESTVFVEFTPDGSAFITQTLKSPPPQKRQPGQGPTPTPPTLPVKLSRWSAATGEREWEVPVPHPERGLDRLGDGGAWHRFTPDLSRVVWLVPAVVEYGKPADGELNAVKLVAPAEVHTWAVSAAGEFSDHWSHTLSWHFAADPAAVAAVTEQEAPAVVNLENGTAVVGNFWNAQVFDLASGRASAVCRGQGMATKLAVSDDRSRLFIPLNQSGEEFLVGWDLRTGDEVARVPIPNPYRNGTGEFDVKVVDRKVRIEYGGKKPFVYELDGSPTPPPKP